MDARHPLAVVTPTLDGDVLAHLALTHAAFTPGQLKRLLPKASVEGVRKVLNRLTKHGVVTATRVGNAAVIYELNREHLAAEAIIDLANQAKTLRQRIEALLADWTEPPVYAAMFGSWARGAADTDSDVDLFLVRPNDAEDENWDLQIDALEHAVARWTGNDARAFVVEEARLSQMRSEPVLMSIRSEGLTLHGEPAWFRSIVKPRRLSKPSRRSDEDE